MRDTIMGARNRQRCVVRSEQTAQPQKPAWHFTCFGYCVYFDWLLYCLQRREERIHDQFDQRTDCADR